MKRLARLLALAVTLSLVLSMPSRTARADTAAAQVLFDEAKKLMTAGKHAEACPKLEESQRLDPGIGTQFNLASCYEQVGRTASAWSLFLEVAGAAKAAGQADRDKVARQRAAALEKKLIRLSITAPPDAPSDLQVKRDGVVMGNAQLGSAVPVDPGAHTIEATAAGKVPFVKQIELSEPGATETVAIPALQAGGTAPVAPPPGWGAYAPGYPPPEGKPATRRRSRGMMAGGIVLISVGAVAGVLGGLVSGACANRSCEERAGYGLIAGGVVGLGVGIPLTIVGARKVPVEKKAESAAAPALVVGPGSMTLQGTF